MQCFTSHSQMGPWDKDKQKSWVKWQESFSVIYFFNSSQIKPFGLALPLESCSELSGCCWCSYWPGPDAVSSSWEPGPVWSVSVSGPAPESPGRPARPVSERTACSQNALGPAASSPLCSSSGRNMDNMRGQMLCIRTHKGVIILFVIKLFAVVFVAVSYLQRGRPCASSETQCEPQSWIFLPAAPPYVWTAVPAVCSVTTSRIKNALVNQCKLC